MTFDASPNEAGACEVDYEIHSDSILVAGVILFKE